MAPVTRSSVHGRQSQTAHPLPMMDEAGDDHSSQAEGQNGIDSFRQGSNSPFRSNQDILLPLQETANRVSRQVEDFAKALDRFRSERSPSDQELWVDAFDLLKQYSTVTHNRADQTATRGRNSIGDDRNQVTNLRLEANLWLLTERLLMCKCPEAVASAEDQQETSLKDLTRYSTNWDIWDSFLNSDTVAQEYECSLDWLQDTAEESSSSLEDVVADKTKKSDRGDGIWSAGLIYTKDSIKKVKRSRAWGGPLDISVSSIPAELKLKEGKTLVSQMDPDAPNRENGMLAEADEHHEDAAWRICWEMLRRGMKFGDIRQWWYDRNESWRTALLQGGAEIEGGDSSSPWLRIINIASNPEWFKKCKELSAQGAGRTPHETGVYGILAGNYDATAESCNSLDDILFSSFNAGLVRRFEAYVAAYKRRLKDPQIVSWQPGSSLFPQIKELLLSAEDNELLKAELQQPNKLIEAAILGQNLDEFFIQQGEAASEVAHITLQSSHLIPKEPDLATNELAHIAADDQDAVRIVAHLQLLMKQLGLLEGAYNVCPHILDNNIVNYIGFLEREAKYSLLPLYASTLGSERAAHVLGTILINVIDPRERELQVKLLRQYDINVPGVLLGIYQLANFEGIKRLKGIKDSSNAASITSYVANGSVKYIKIRPDFMDTVPASGSNEEKVVRSVQWFRHIDVGSWELAAAAMASTYKLFLLTGRLSAAQELTRSASVAAISIAATGMNLRLAGIDDDASANGDGDVDMDGSNISIEDRIQPVSPTRRRKDSRSGRPNISAKQRSSREELAAQSRIWAELETLVLALEALDNWQSLATEVELLRGDPRQMRAMKHELQDVLRELQQAVEPIFEYDYLMLSADEAEKAHLEIIRNHYIPELVLGYNSALYFAGHSLTRSYLTECMELAQLVAQNEIVTAAFVASGRMRELVNAFALDSQALLRANEAGGKISSNKKAKRDSISSDGKANIWQVSWQEDLEDE